jgi:hypothetical protein
MLAEVQKSTLPMVFHISIEQYRTHEKTGTGRACTLPHGGQSCLHWSVHTPTEEEGEGSKWMRENDASAVLQLCITSQLHGNSAARWGNATCVGTVGLGGASSVSGRSMWYVLFNTSLTVVAVFSCSST